MIAMASPLRHRGPDAEGVWSAPGVGLVHRRLSIIDLGGGRQPLGNEDGSIQVVFNGEIYNFRELRRELKEKGHQFRTNSDTEVLVHLYEEMGERLVERLRGMFAFALWDGRKRELLLARDRLGLKPLYYYRDREKLLFGSEVKAILAFPGVPREIDLEALEDYLSYGVVPGQRSILCGIQKLLPGHVLAVEEGNWNPAPKRYWELDATPDEGRTLSDWMEALQAKFEETVRAHLIADVPVGAFLSGGLDSSAIVAMAAKCGAADLQTFSIGFEEERFSELPYARMVARRLAMWKTSWCRRRPRVWTTSRSFSMSRSLTPLPLRPCASRASLGSTLR
jgi:asparagine synthase (glutamine-hydrolysing)